MSSRGFAPVFLPEGRGLRDRASQTFLRHYNACPRSGYLYTAFKGEASTVEMQRGKALHAVCERATRAMIEAEEPQVPGELVKAIVNEVLADPEFPVAFEEHDYIRESAFRWARDTVIDPNAVVACETLFVLNVRGFEVRAKIDFAQLLENGGAVLVRDYKSSRALPAAEDVSRKRPDGTLMAKNFQLVLYALMLAHGVPVREEICGTCDGSGAAMYLLDGTLVEGDIAERERVYRQVNQEVRFESCVTCRRGVVEIPEPMGVAGRAQRFDLEFVFPGIEGKDGLMATRAVSLTLLELAEYMASLEALVERVRLSEVSGDWPAVVSDSGCSECPAMTLCPIPKELRDHRGTINTLEEAAEAATVLDRRRAVDDAIRKEIKAFAKAQGVPIRFGADQVFEFGYSESERIADRDEMFDAMERSVRYGEPFERARFVKTVRSSPFKQRTLTGEELAAEAAESDQEVA